MSLKKRFTFSKKTVVIASVIAVVLLAGITIAIVISQQKSPIEEAANAVEKPQFSTVVPKGTSIDKLGGWSRISPPSADPVFAYNDKIGTQPINISEQALPASFKDDVDNQVAELAKKFSATNQLTAGNTTVYFGTSSKGPQSVIFTKNNLLILIKSQQIIEDKDWLKYIESLS